MDTGLDRCGKQGRILVVTAVDAEREAVLRGINEAKVQAGLTIEVLAAGVGPIAAAVNTTRFLAATQWDLVISAGIGGAFQGRAEVGTLVLASEIIGADLGVETLEGFSSLDEMGFGRTRILPDIIFVDKLLKALEGENLPVCVGPILTVSTATGTAASTTELLNRVPEAAVEAMEGFGVAQAAQSMGIPVLELRAISNMVGPRDRGAWRIKEALEALQAASRAVVEVL